MTHTALTAKPSPAYNPTERAISILRDYLDLEKKPDIVELIQLIRFNCHSLSGLTDIRDLALEAAIQAEYRRETVASSVFSQEGRKTFADVAVEAYRGIKDHTGASVTWEAFSGGRR